MRAIFARASRATGGHSDLASVTPQWASMPHQINATFPSVVDDDTAYVLCRAIQVLLPGEPQLYYVGLLDGRDDRDRFAATGQGREVNRHVFHDAELDGRAHADRAPGAARARPPPPGPPGVRRRIPVGATLGDVGAPRLGGP